MYCAVQHCSNFWVRGWNPDPITWTSVSRSLGASQTWFSALITVIFIHPVPYYSRIEHAGIYPVCRFSLGSVGDNRAARVPVALCCSGQQSKRPLHPRHTLLDSIIIVLPLAKLFQEFNVGLGVVCFQKPVNSLRESLRRWNEKYFFSFTSMVQRLRRISNL